MLARVKVAPLFAVPTASARSTLPAVDRDALRRLVKTILPEAAVAALRKRPRRPRAGLPPTLDPSILDQVLGEMKRPRPRSVQYQNLTTWKNTGTFRLILRFEHGGEERLIYKRAVYSLEEIPANEGLPVRQGPPEQVIAQAHEGPLTKFVPRAYWTQEDEDGEYFDYLWEDLSVRHEHFLEYQKLHPQTSVCESLAAMHHALRGQFAGREIAEFLRFDEAYAEGIWVYTLAALPGYLQRTGDPVVRTFLERQDEVRAVFLDSSFHVDRPMQPIHGDCNGTNMWVRDHEGGLRLKAVDWEWAGYGLPHADIISIVKWRPAEEQDEFLRRYCAAAGLEDIMQERRWLRRANMERAMLDAGFLAKQYQDPARSQSWFRGFVRGSLEHLLHDTEVFASGKS